MSENASVTITRQSGYQFLVDFGETLPQLLADEPAPLGQGTGPAPDHMLLAAVANCLSASLLFSLQKFKQDPGTLVATATRGGTRSTPMAPERRASSRSRLRPCPGIFSTLKPRSANPRRTAPATVKVARRASGADRSAMRSITVSDHMAGLVEGAKPSRNQASARPVHWASAQSTSPMATSTVARKSGSSIL